MIKRVIDLDLSTTITYKIRACETDHLGHLKLSAIFQLMQETAEDNAKTLKLNYEEINQNKEIWVLSRIHAKFFNIPKWENKVKIKTWPVGVKGIFAVRDYLIKTVDMKSVGKITSSWLIVDAVNRRVKRMRNFPESSLTPLFAEIAQKVKAPSEGYLVTSRKVQKSELDVNKHVNNAVYYNWITDSLDLDQYNKNMISELSVNYSAEARLGDAIDIYHYHKGNYLYITAKNITTKRNALVAKALLSDRKAI
ncbi:MAG: acyl-[acyl-carrier-protein] thioesterase [Clostridia bacterium]